MFFEEAHDPGPRIGPVLRFGKAVPLVFIAQVLDLTSARTERRDDLLGLLDRNARVVRGSGVPAVSAVRQKKREARTELRRAAAH